MHRSHKPAEAYQLKLHSSGKWELTAGVKKLASGLIALPENSWNSIQLDARGDKITAIVNGQSVAEITDSTYSHGMIGLGSSFNEVDFDNVKVH